MAFSGRLSALYSSGLADERGWNESGWKRGRRLGGAPELADHSSVRRELDDGHSHRPKERTGAILPAAPDAGEKSPPIARSRSARPDGPNFVGSISTFSTSRFKALTHATRLRRLNAKSRRASGFVQHVFREILCLIVQRL